MNIVKSNSSW